MKKTLACLGALVMLSLAGCESRVREARGVDAATVQTAASDEECCEGTPGAAAAALP